MADFIMMTLHYMWMATSVILQFTIFIYVVVCVLVILKGIIDVPGGNGLFLRNYITYLIKSLVSFKPMAAAIYFTAGIIHHMEKRK